MASTSLATTLAPDGAMLCRALTDPSTRAAFRDIPVDWHDAAAGAWRPTAIAQTGAAEDAGIHVYVPLDDGVAMAPVSAAHLRLARGQSDAVMRFWTIRYRLRLLRTLASRLQAEEAAAVDGAVEDLSRAEAEMRDVWHTAYAHGLPPRSRRSVLRPAAVRLVATGRSERDAMAGRCPTGPGGLLTTALDLYGEELERLRIALAGTGVGPRELRQHPFVTALAVLLASATAELLRCAPPLDDSVALDPAVWGVSNSKA